MGSYRLAVDTSVSYVTDTTYTFDVQSMGDVTGCTYTIICLFPDPQNPTDLTNPLYKLKLAENATADSFKWSPTSSEFGPLMPNSASCLVGFEISTTSSDGAASYGGVKYLTLKMNPAKRPNVVNVKMELTDAFQEKSLSNVTEHKLSFDVYGTYGASQNITVEVDGKVFSKKIDSSGNGTKESVSFDLKTLNSTSEDGETKTISIKAVDSRGMIGKNSVSVLVYKYSYPTPSSDAHVAWGEGDDIDEPYLTFGCSFQENVAGVANSMVSINVYLNDLTTVLVDVLGHPSPNVIPGTYDIGESYVFRVEFTDKVGTTVGYYDLMRQLVVMDTSADGNMVSFFQAASNSANGTKFGIFADKTQIGDNDKRHVILDSDGVTFYANTDTDSRLAASISVGYNDDGTAKTPLLSAYTFGKRKTNTVERSFSFVEGDGNEASGYASHAGGQGSIAHGMLSYAFGDGVVSYQNGHFAVGSYNVSDKNDTTGAKKIFSVGNGANNDNRSDAFVVKNNGDVSAGGWFRTSGDDGWVNDKYGGGWYMADETWIRAYNNKNIFTGGSLKVSTQILSEGDIIAHNVIKAGGEFAASRSTSTGTHNWHFGPGTGNGDSQWFLFYDEQYGLHGGFYAPEHRFQCLGEIVSTTPNAFRAAYGTRGFIIRNDGGNTYFMQTNENDSYGGWNNNYSYIDMASGQWILRDNKGHLEAPILTSNTDAYRVVRAQVSGNNFRFDDGNGTARYCTGSTSDIRLKTNLTTTEVTDALSVVNSMKLHSFDWKEDGRHQQIGFVADELEKLDPLLTYGGGLTEEGNMNAKVVDSFYMLGYVVKALQELNEELNKVKKELSSIRRAK